MGQKAQEAKENTKGAAHSANQKAQEKSGQTKEKASEMGQFTKEAAQSGKQNTGGFLQQTGEKVKEMAQGATEAVKQTFGMAPQNDEDKDYYPTQHGRE